MNADMTGAREAAKALKNGRTRKGTQRRIESSFYLALMPICLLAGRLVQLQALGNKDGVDFGAEKHTILKPRRADILAADGTAMAVTLDEYAVCANPRVVKRKPEMAQILTRVLGGDDNAYLAQLDKTERAGGKPNRYVRLAKRVDETRVQQLKLVMRMPLDAAIRGDKPQLDPVTHKLIAEPQTKDENKARREFWSAISFEPSPRRTYPMGNFASQLIGFTAPDGRGVDGLERSFNGDLGGTPGEVVSPLDGEGRPISGFVRTMTPPQEGRTVVTTIDPEIQADADSAIQELVTKWKPNFAVAIVMRPQTGEVLAMASAPSFDLNNKPANVAELATNRATQFSYEPGSTFKIITASASVETVPDWATKHFYVTGEETVGKHKIHDWQWWSGKAQAADKTLSDGIRDSSNITMWHFAHLVGAPNMLHYAQQYGIGEAIDSPGLKGPAGILDEKTGNWSAEQLANFSFGQGLTMTPMHLAQIVSTVANNGLMMKPMIIRELRDAGGKVVRTYQPQTVRQVIKPETAHEVQKMMARVMSEGTARKAGFVPGYRTAGKTGSAQKSDGPRGYSSGRFISSLAGFVPLNNPKYVVIVLADEPHGSHWGSEVCGPPWAKIAGKAMLHLRLREGASAPSPDPTWMKLPPKV